MENKAPVAGLSPRRVVRALRARALYIVIPVFLLTAAAALYTRKMPERFRAQALIASEAVGSPEYLTGRVDAAAAVNVQDQLRTIRETVLGDAVLETVVREFQLPASGPSQDLDQAMEALKSKIQILVEGPTSFYIGFEGDDRRQVMQIANRLAGLFIERTSDIRGERVKQEDQFLDAEVERLRRQMSAQEESVKSYKESTAQVLPERLANNLKQIEDLRQQTQSKTDLITEVQARRSAVMEEMQTLEKQGALEPDPVEKSTTETAIDELRLKLAQLKTRYTAEYPEIQRAERELRDLEAIKPPARTRRGPSPANLRYFTLKAELASIDQRVKNYLQERSALASDMADYERRINASPGLESELGRRMREAAVARTRYETLYSKQQEARLAHRAVQSAKSVAFKIVEPASLPPIPSGPHGKRILLMSFLASLGLGLVTALVLENMDTSFATVEDFQAYTNTPVLTSVPAITSRSLRTKSGKQTNGLLRVQENAFSPTQKRHFEDSLVAPLSDRPTVAAEQYRVLSLKVQRWMQVTGGRVLVVTSSSGGEGKSLTALNLALTLASSEEGRVLLVDCDLRRPQVGRYLGLDDVEGFGGLLERKATSTAEYVTKIGNLDVIPGGSRTMNATGLLASQNARETIARLKENYKLIVLDSPPIIPIADSHILAGLADGVLMVVRARQTKRELFRHAMESLGATNVLGVVLNDVHYADSTYAYACRYYHRHYLGRR